MRSAINNHRREGLCPEIVAVTLPEKSGGREVWLTRSDVACLLRSAWRVFVTSAGRRKSGCGLAAARKIYLVQSRRGRAACGAARTSVIARYWRALKATCSSDQWFLCLPL